MAESRHTVVDIGFVEPVDLSTISIDESPGFVEDISIDFDEFTSVDETEDVMDSEIIVDADFVIDGGSEVFDGNVEVIDFVDSNLSVGRESSLVVKRRLPAKIPTDVPNTVAQYSDVLSRTVSAFKGTRIEKKASYEELAKKLTSFYHAHNKNIVPSIVLDKGGSTPSAFILYSVRNRLSVDLIVEELSKKFEGRNIVLSDGSSFKVTEIVKRRFRDLIVLVKNYYESELALFDSNSKHSVDNAYDNVIKYMAGVEVLFKNVGILCYPRAIDLENRQYVCGSCGTKSEFSRPFVRSIISNADSLEWVFTVLPAFEYCMSCDHANVLPGNYFKVISDGLKKAFVAGPVDEVRSRLRALHSEFTVCDYEPSPEEVSNVLTPDISGLFVRFPKSEVVDSGEDRFDYKFDLRSEVAAFKEYEKSLLPIVSRKVTEKDYVVNGLSEEILSDFRSKFTRIMCGVVGSDYFILKKKAINSLIYFIEDSIPYVSSPYVVLMAYSDYHLGVMSETDYLSVSLQFHDVKLNFLKYKDLFSFVPLIHSTLSHDKFERYVSDDEVRYFLDYCSDNIILFSLRNEILKLTSYEKVHGELNKTVFEKLLKNLFVKPMGSKTSGIDVGAKKLQEIIVMGDSDALLYRMERMSLKFMCAEYNSFVGFDYSIPFRYMSNKDVWNLYKVLNGELETDKFVSELPGLESLRENVKMFGDEVMSKSRAEFYYQELFEGVDLSQVDVSSVDVPCRPPVDGRDFEEYFRSLKQGKELKASKEMVKCSDWFDGNISNYFGLLAKYLISGSSISDLLFMDVVGALSCNSLDSVLRFFGISESLAALLLSDSQEFVLPVSDPDEISAKMVLEKYDYVDSDLKLMASQLEGQELIDALESDLDLLASEFREESAEIKQILKEGLGIDVDPSVDSDEDIG
jgi:hypothetical protein